MIRRPSLSVRLTRGHVGRWIATPNHAGGLRWTDTIGNVAATAANSPTWTRLPRPGGSGYVMRFTNGTEQGWPIGKSYGTHSAFSWSFWARRTGSSAYAGIFMTRGGANTMGVHVASTGTGITCMWADEASTYNWTGGPTMTADTWFYYVVTVTGSRTVVYQFTVNGTLTTATNTYSFTSTQALDVPNIGRDVPGTFSANRAFPGELDDLNLFVGVELSSFEARMLFEESRLRRWPDQRLVPLYAPTGAPAADPPPWLLDYDLAGGFSTLGMSPC